MGLKKIIDKVQIISVLLLFFFNSAYTQSLKVDTLRLYYDIDKSTVSENGLEQIEKAVQLLKENSGSCQIIGYADYLAGNNYNKILSTKRANVVKNQLLSKGVSPQKLTNCQGKGEQPFIGIETDSGEQENRRVDIVVISTNKSVNNIRNTIENINNLDIGQTLILDNMFFQPGRHFLKEQSKPSLIKLLQIMQDNPTLSIEIQGHICCWNSPGDGLDMDTQKYNLSESRAKHIYDFLVEKNIEASRMSYKGFARTKPLVENELTDEDQNKNRRVEIMVTKK